MITVVMEQGQKVPAARPMCLPLREEPDSAMGPSIIILEATPKLRLLLIYYEVMCQIHTEY
jgi:hypothetical protein